MTDTMRTGPGRTRRPLFSTPGGRFVGGFGVLVIILLATFGSYFVFRTVSTQELKTAQTRIVELESQNQKLTGQIGKNAAAAAEMQSKLKAVQDKLDAIMPSQDTYNLAPNEAVRAGGGFLSLGLVGSPGNDNVAINVNGKQQTVNAGDVLSVEPNEKTTCTIVVQSFDMFKALVHASCAAKR